MSSVCVYSVLTMQCHLRMRKKEGERERACIVTGARIADCLKEPCILHCLQAAAFDFCLQQGERPHRIGNCRVRGNNPCCYCGEGKAAQSWSYWGRKNRRNKEEIIRSILLLVCLICFRIISEWCTPDFCVLGLDRGMLQARSGSLRPRIKEWCYAEELCTKLHL